MTNPLDKLVKLQQAWQSQCSKPIDVKPDQLLKIARLQRWVYFCVDVFVISVLLGVGGWMLWFAFRDIHNEWPWLIYSACMVSVVGFMLFHRWRRRRHAAHYDQPMLAHVEWSIKDIEHRMWMDRYTFWWYILPIALGCMIPPAISFAMEYGKRPRLDSLIPLLLGEAVFAAVFYFVHWAIKKGQRIGLQGQLKELQALRTLRETLLNSEEPHT